MELKEAIEKLKRILLQRDEINKIEDKEEREIEKSAYFEEMPFDEIDTVLEELNNRIPKEKVENLINTKCYGFVEGNAEFPELATEMKIIRYIKAEDLEGIL